MSIELFNAKRIKKSQVKSFILSYCLSLLNHCYRILKKKETERQAQVVPVVIVFILHA